MDKKKYNIEEDIQKTMESLDAIRRVEGNPFLFTRLQERLWQEENGQVANKRTLAPLWQIAMVTLLIFVNAFALSQSGYFAASTDNVATIDDLATEYLLTASEEDLDYLNYNE